MAETNDIGIFLYSSQKMVQTLTAVFLDSFRVVTSLGFGNTVAIVEVVDFVGFVEKSKIEIDIKLSI